MNLNSPFFRTARNSVNVTSKPRLRVLRKGRWRKKKHWLAFNAKTRVHKMERKTTIFVKYHTRHYDVSRFTRNSFRKRNTNKIRVCTQYAERSYRMSLAREKRRRMWRTRSSRGGPVC